MSADQEVDDGFISVRIKNVGGRRNTVLFHMSGMGCQERATQGLLLYACNASLWIAFF